MTTEYIKNRSPRLPENHPAYVEKILARVEQPPRRRRAIFAALSALTLAWIVIALFFIYYT